MWLLGNGLDIEVNMVKRWLWLILLAGLLASCGEAKQAAVQMHGAVFDPPRMLTDFTMKSTEGTDFTLSQHKGQTILLYFGYRSCPDFCPTTFAELNQIYAALKQPRDKLKVVFVTVDPDREALGKWIEANGYRIVGASREIYLKPQGVDSDPIVEIQWPVEKAVS